MISGNFEGDVANFSCSTGYELNGNAMLVCRDGQWSSTIPFCDIISKCHEMEYVRKGKKEYCKITVFCIQ